MSTMLRRAALMVAAFALVWSASAVAQPLHGPVIFVSREPPYGPFVHDPFWPFWAPYHPYEVRPSAEVRVHVTPKQADVYVDGFLAGVAGDFDGVFARLRTTPGGHAITLHLEGYRTVMENIYVRPGATFKIHETMEKLAPGEVSEGPPAALPRKE